MFHAFAKCNANDTYVHILARMCFVPGRLKVQATQGTPCRCLLVSSSSSTLSLSSLFVVVVVVVRRRPFLVVVVVVVLTRRSLLLTSFFSSFRLDASVFVVVVVVSRLAAGSTVADTASRRRRRRCRSRRPKALTDCCCPAQGDTHKSRSKKQLLLRLTGWEIVNDDLPALVRICTLERRKADRALCRRWFSPSTGLSGSLDCRRRVLVLLRRLLRPSAA